jgi:glycosyltransferase involved in cell wall biosynthesis
MKIMMIISNTQDRATGTASVAWNLKTQFERLGCVCDLIFSETILAAVKGVIKQFIFAFALPLRRGLRTYDVLDVNPGDGLFVGLWFRYVRPLRRPLLVARSHGLEHVVHFANLAEARAGKLHLSWKYPIYHGGYRLWQVKKYLQIADLLLFLNEYDKAYAIAHFGVDASRAKVVQNGLPDAFIGLRRKFFLGDSVRIAIVGAFLPRKGIEYAVPALDRLLTRNAKLEVGFFGTGLPCGAIAKRFSNAAQERLFVNERYEQEDLPGYISGYNVLLFASLAEGFPLAPLEAMACGLAPVVTNIPGIAERLTHGANALVIPPRDQASIETTVQLLIDDPDLLLRLRSRAYEFAQTFSWSGVAAETIALYESAIARKTEEMRS